MLTLIVGTAPQYENPPSWALTHTCAIMTDETMSPVDAYAAAVVYNKPPQKSFFFFYQISIFLFNSCAVLGCYEWSQKAFIAALRNTKIESHPEIGRSWFWQKCNEFGFFQTTYPGTR